MGVINPQREYFFLKLEPLSVNDGNEKKRHLFSRWRLYLIPKSAIRIPNSFYLLLSNSEI